MAYNENLHLTVLSTTFIFGIALIFFAYQKSTTFLVIHPKLQVIQGTKHSLTPFVVKKPKASQTVSKSAKYAVPKQAKYASFTKENAIRNHFQPLVARKTEDILTFEISFNKTASDLSNVTVLKYGEFIRILEDVEVDKIDIECVDMQVKSDFTKICVYKRENDLFVSGSIRNIGNWEGYNLEGLGTALQGKPDMVFIDIGCNIGTFTTYTLLFGNPTLCIDPLMANLEVMMKTLRLTKDEKNVFLLWNAVSDKHEKVILSQGQADNIGSTRVIKLNETYDTKTKAANYEVQTIILDDLQDILTNRRIFIKMDIESYEWKALQGGENFFKKTNVCYVMMEIAAHKISDTGLKIYNFLSQFGLYPFTDVEMRKSLNITQITDWPAVAIFVKNTTECSAN